MKILKGITASTGIASGRTCLYSEESDENIPHYVISSKNTDNEIERLKNAYGKAREILSAILLSSKNINKNAEEILKAHQMILEDKTLFDKAVRLIRANSINAEHALADVFTAYMTGLEAKGLHFAELKHDLVDVRNRVLSSFSGATGHFECPVGDREAVIVVSRRLTPSMILTIPREHVLAFITEEGGLTTHANIIARSYGVPIIFGVDIENNISCGDKVIVDGFSGKVIMSPDRETEDAYSHRMDRLSRRKRVCEVKKKEPAKTEKGNRICLKVNITTPGELDLIKGIRFDGVGLLRTEFLFLEKDRPPSEDEQVRMYEHILAEAEGQPVVLRLLDVGGDKLPRYLSLPQQDNPDLGIRGARALSFFKKIYMTQTKAVLRSAVSGDLRVLYPMVSDMNDINCFRRLIAEAKSELRKDGRKFKNKIKEGIMIETPAAAVMADSLLKNVDFANIGSNDLLQYTLAASRGNVYVENEYHILHPALIRLMEHIIKAGKNNKTEVCLCGEIASFEEYYPLFLSLGLSSFSVPAANFENIKCSLLHEKPADNFLVERFFNAVSKKDIDRLFHR
ncbi:MAG: phosphoenolpyruvate--protein phosphotransferase [Candidatus Omnitrophota bacterium]